MDQPTKPRLKEPVPYIVGFALTYKQLYAAACAELTEDLIHRHYNGDPFLTFRAECFLKSKEYDVIAFPTPPSDSDKVRVRYLYIIEVIPSWTGANPRATLTRKAADRFYDEHGRQEVLRRLFTACLPWPPRDPEPWWLKNHMWDNVKIIQEQREARLALKASNNTESDVAATPSNSPTTVDASATLSDQPTPQNSASPDALATEAESSSSSTDAKAHPNDITSHPSSASTAPACEVSTPQDQASTRPRRACTMKNQRQASR